MIPYVQLEIKESLEARKTFLSSEINLLHIIKKLEAYKKLRKTEFAKKQALKRSARECIIKVNSLAAELPGVETKGLKFSHNNFKRETFQDAKKRVSIEQELEEIKSRLAKLA